MALPAFASVADLRARIPDGIAAADEDRADAVLYDASTLIRAEADTTWVNDSDELEDVPEIVFVVTLMLARRAFVNPDGVRSEGIDTYTVSWGPEDGYWREEVRRAAGQTSVWSLSTTRAEDDLPDTRSVIHTYDDVPDFDLT